MTTTAEPQTLADAGPCGWCTHLQWSHKRGKGGCKELDCPCGKYDPPKQSGPSPADDWPLPAAEIEDAEAAGLVVRPESPAVEESVVAAALGELHVLPAAEPPGPVDVVKRRRREPEPLPGGDPEPDPAAQAEYAEQVAAIDAQLTESEPSDDEVADEIDRAEDAAEIEQLTADRAQLSEQLMARLRDLDQAQTRIAQLEQHVRALAAERNDERTANAAMHRDLAQQEQIAAREKGALTAENLRLRGELDRSDTARKWLQEQLDYAVRTGLSAAARVLWKYDADQCVTCGKRFTRWVEHEHPLTPVTVLVVQRGPSEAEATAPADDTSKEQ